MMANRLEHKHLELISKYTVIHQLLDIEFGSLHQVLFQNLTAGTISNLICRPKYIVLDWGFHPHPHTHLSRPDTVLHVIWKSLWYIDLSCTFIGDVASVSAASP